MMKLLKYEIRRGYEQYLILFVAMIGVALMVRFGGFSQVMNDGGMISENGSLQVSAIAAIILIMIYGLLVFGSIVFVGLQILRNFNRSMFKSQGYLTLTLPVSTTKLLLSKMLVASFWFGLTILAIFISSILMTEVSLTLGSIFGANVDIQLLAVSVIEFMISTMQSVLCAYMIITFVHTKYVKSHRILVAIITYIAISIVQLGISYVFQSDAIMQASTLGFTVSSSSVSSTDALETYTSIIYEDMFVQLGLAIIWGAVYFFVCKYLLQRKIELD